MKRNLIRLVVGFGLATGIIGLVETVAYARIGANHSEPPFS